MRILRSLSTAASAKAVSVYTHFRMRRHVCECVGEKAHVRAERRILRPSDAAAFHVCIHKYFLLLLLWGKDETPDIEDLGSVLCNSTIQTLRLPTIRLFSPMITQVRQRDFCAEV
jgi:hypothetical protein